MQAISRLPWSGDQLSGKMSDKAVMELPGSSNFKRKVSFSAEPLSPPSSHVKKPRSNLQQRLPLDLSSVGAAKAGIGAYDSAATAYATPGPTPTTSTARDYLNSEPSAHAAMPACAGPPRDGAEAIASDLHEHTSSAASKLSPLKQAIENQLNMQLLLKHNEVRLIEQELAKCQVAYEQLRRCELRPYPGSRMPDASVTAGTGPAISPPSGYSKPTHAAPYGVVDGPYSRHYSRWLLADSQFDPEPVRAHYVSDAHAASRSMRMSGSSARKSVGKSVPMPAQFGDFPPSLPNYPTALPRKEKSGPLILRRSTDNKLVKLVCNDCNRGDMNSIQGFLNHCRIAHKVDYKSHDQAAVDCGRPLDDQEIANLPAETQATPVSKPTRSAPARASTASVVPIVSSGAVHPYNVAGAPIPRSKPQSGKKRAPAKVRSTKPSTANQSHQAPFKPSSQAPRLSAFFAKNNVGGDLDQAIENAKQRVDLGLEEDFSSPHASAPSSPSVAVHGTDVQAPAGAVARPVSRKGYRQPAQRPRPSPLAPASVQRPVQHGEVPESPQDHSMSLSPHTADSNPGLMSDMEDDDHGSASEEETAVPPPSRGTLLPVTRACSDVMDIDVAVDDEMDEHGVIIRRNSMLGSDVRTMRPSGGPSKLG